MVLGKLDIHMQNNETDPHLTPYRKVNSKCLIKDLNIRSKTLEVQEVNIEVKLFDIGLSNDFCGFDAKTKGNKSKNKQMGLHQTKKLLPSKGNHQQKDNLSNGRKYLQTTCLIRG